MDYNNGKIYQILNNINDEVYVGSTIQPLSKRLHCHKSHSDSLVRKNKLHELMRTIGKNNCYIELIENYPCNTKEELFAREGHYIRERATLNHQIAGRTRKERREVNAEHIKEQQRIYDEGRKELVKEKNKPRRECIAERMKQYRQDNAEYYNHYNKQYYQANKQKLSEYNKQYRENNIDRLREQDRVRNKVQIICPNCDNEVCKSYLKKHQETKKCKSYVKPIENED